MAKPFIAGKIYNSRWVLERGLRDHGLRIETDLVEGASARLATSLEAVWGCDDDASLRGVE